MLTPAHTSPELHNLSASSTMSLQDQFFTKHLGQERLSAINVHLSAIVKELGQHAEIDLLQQLKIVLEDNIYRQSLKNFDGDLFSGKFPQIRTSSDKHAISDTDRSVVVETVKQLHTELGCKAELQAPCTFLQHIKTVLDFFEEQHASGKWTKSTLAGKTVHILQFLEMTSQFNLKQEYHAVFTTLLESLPDDAPRQTLKPEFVDTLHANIKKLTEEAMQELKCVDNFEFKYYPDGICPFQCVMDAICLLYLWGTTVDNSNDRRVLQTFAYKSIDTDESHDNYLYEENGHMFLRLNHLTKVFKTFEPHTINLSETNAPLADILKQWKPVAEKYQSGKTFEVYLRTRKVTKHTPTPDRSNPYVLFQYDYSSCNSNRGQLGAPLGTKDRRLGHCIKYQGNGMHKQLLAAAKRLGYEKEEAKLIASCNEQRHVEIAANHPIDRPSAEQQQLIEERAKNRGSSAHMSTKRYAQDNREAGAWKRRRGNSQEDLTGISDEDLLAVCP
jgi:hypothetical protein